MDREPTVDNAYVKIVFAHPLEVAQADQAAAAIGEATVRLRDLVPRGIMYVLCADVATTVRYGFELHELADEVLPVEPLNPLRGPLA